MCPVNSQNEEKLAYYAVSPAHGRSGSLDEVKISYYAYAHSLAHARGGSQDEEKILLLPPFTPRPYLGYRDYHIVWNICLLVVLPPFQFMAQFPWSSI